MNAYCCTKMNFCNHPRLTMFLIVIIVILALFDAVMKAIALWKAGRNNHLLWFIFIAIFNTIGILPIIYLIWQKRVWQKKKE